MKETGGIPKIADLIAYAEKHEANCRRLAERARHRGKESLATTRAHAALRWLMIAENLRRLP